LPYIIGFLRAGDSNGDAIVVKYGYTNAPTIALKCIRLPTDKQILIFLSVIATDLTVGVQGPTSNAREHAQSPYHRERGRLYNCQTA
jgi:hypothetical protein